MSYSVRISDLVANAFDNAALDGVEFFEGRLYACNAAARARDASPQEQRNDCRQFRSAGNPINGQVDLRGLVVDTAAKHPSMDKDQRQKQHLDAKKTVVEIFLGLGSIILLRHDAGGLNPIR